MILIFGWRNKVHREGHFFAACRRCGNPAAHALIRVQRWFTLFFIPVIPSSRTWVTTCTYCGAQMKVSHEEAQHLKAMGIDQAPPPASPAPTGPPTSTAQPDAAPWSGPTPLGGVGTGLPARPQLGPNAAPPSSEPTAASPPPMTDGDAPGTGGSAF